MTTSPSTRPAARPATGTVPPADAGWLRLAQASIALAVPALLLFAYVGTFETTISGGDFRYTADYWFTGVGVPIGLVGIGVAWAVHRLQHGADGRLGTIGTWINTVALAELIVQLGASVVAGSELRWGPSYIVFTALTFLGVALLAAGSWRAGLLPRWMLGVWPVVWILGSFAAPGPMPVVLVVFFVVMGIALTRRVTARSV